MQKPQKYKPIGFFGQLRLALWKNWLLKKRTWKGTLVEIFLPVILMALLSALRGAISTDVQPDRFFVDQQMDTRTYPDGLLGWTNYGDTFRMGIAPDTPATRRFVEFTSNRSDVIFNTNPQSADWYRFFDSEASLLAYVNDVRYTRELKPLTTAVVFEDDGSGTGGLTYSYKLFLNATEQIDTRTSVDNLAIGYDDWSFWHYANSKILSAQYSIDIWILNEAGLGQVSQVTFAPMPLPAVTTDIFFEIISDLLPIFFVLSYLYPVSRLIGNLVQEKENRIREGMSIMGLRPAVFWLSWYITYIVMFFITTIFISLSTKNIFKFSDPGLIFFYFFLYGLSMVSYASLISVFFSKSKIAGTLGMVLVFAGLVPYFIVYNRDSTVSANTAASLLSPSAFGLTVLTIASWETAQQGVTQFTADTVVNDYTFNTGVGMMFFDFILFLLLTLYLDQVVPSEYGTTRHPLFFLQRDYWFGARTQDGTELGLIENSQASNKNMQDVAPELRGTQKVEIKALRKEFESNTAVNNLSLSMYPSQIFALLGHNGAGKTTTISILTGMIEPTSGDALIDGKSIRTSMWDIRQDIGFCPQHDILFPTLTVREHLEIFTTLKGVPKKERAAMIEELIKEVGLTEKVNEQSRNLSGGMKRKLSVAIAFSGGSTVVFLDEPTSGMDPYSRRATWNMLKRFKQDRVIILTTHFMDEADLLGDRIGIMAHGALQCLGSSLFLKGRYGVGYTLTIAKKEEGADEDGIRAAIAEHVPKYEKLTSVGTEFSFRLPLESSAQFEALFDVFDRQKDALGIINYGISVTTLEEVFLKIGHGQQMQDTEHLQRAAQKEIPETLAPDNQTATGRQAGTKTEIFINHVKALIEKRIRYARRDRKALVYQVLIPVLTLIIGIGVLGKLGPPFVYGPKPITMADYNIPNRVPATDSLTSTLALMSDVTPVFAPLASFPTPYNFSQHLFDTRNDYKESKYGAYFADGSQTFIYTNVSAIHGLPTFFNAISQASLRQLRGATAQTSGISVTMAVFPKTKGEASFEASISAIIVALMITIAFCFIPASYAVFIVKERSSKCKHQQIISGVSIPAYWVASYAFDFLTYMMPFWLSLFIILAFNESSFVGENFGALFFLFLSYGLCVIPFTYCWTFLFDSHSAAQNVLLMVYLLSGVVTMILSYILDLVSSTKDTNHSLKYIYRLFPNFCLGNGLLNLAVRDQTFLTGGESLGPLDKDVTGDDIAYLMIGAFLYFLLAIGLDILTWTPDVVRRLWADPEIVDDTVEIDEDVAKEKERVRSGEADQDPILLKGLRKVYRGRYNGKSKVAVKDIWFGVKDGECFGFLGINGAGKTTTLSMMTGDIYPTQGTALLKGMDIFTHPNDVRLLMGYCPQFDSLFDRLTAREHLEMYAKIKGVPAAKLDLVVTTLLDHLSLTEYADRPSGKYSGGNKRKLCVAISLIGSPPIVFLDEPSTGMDPVSRRFMWEFISRTMKGRSVILTTHSMEECEALCNRIGIMVGGRLRCLGTAHHLKHRYGKGYQLDLRTEEEHAPAVQKWILETFPGAVKIEFHGGDVKYQIPHNESLTLGRAFGIVERMRTELHITEYSLSQTSLEQIFIGFAKQQEEETGEIAGLS